MLLVIVVQQQRTGYDIDYVKLVGLVDGGQGRKGREMRLSFCIVSTLGSEIANYVLLRAGNRF